MARTLTLGIDPGADSAWALFDSASCRLLDCGPEATFGSVPLALVGLAVIEHPWIYPRGPKRTRDPNAIVKLAINAGAWMRHVQGFGAGVTMPLPVKWKGSMPKDKHNALVRRTLDERELGVLEGRTRTLGKKAHNVVDAIGLGLFGVGRLVPA